MFGGSASPVTARSTVVSREIVPPNDLDAEGSVIASVLVDPVRFVDVTEIVAASDFYSDANRRIWEALVELDRSGSRIDIVAVATWLRAHELLAQVGGTPYLAELAGSIPAVAHVEQHARTVADKAYQRRLIAELQRAAAEGYFATDAREWGQETERRVFESATAHRAETPNGTLDVVIPETVDAMMARSRGDRPATGRVISTGLGGLDRKLGGGFRCGNKYTIAGRPGMGKSAFVLQCVSAAAKHGAAVLVSAEMPREQIATRLLSQETGVLEAKLQSGALRADDWERVTAQVNRLRGLPVSIVFQPRATSSQVRTIVRREVSRLRRIFGGALELAMVAIDHLHIMDGEPQRGENEQAVLTRLSKSNLWIAGEFNCVVAELAQLNRGLESRTNTDKRPSLSDLRGSGSIEEDAHTVLFPFRPRYYDKDYEADMWNESAAPEEAEIIVAKQRGGTTGKVACAFHGQTLRFLDIDYGTHDPGDFRDGM